LGRFESVVAERRHLGKNRVVEGAVSARRAAFAVVVVVVVGVAAWLIASAAWRGLRGEPLDRPIVLTTVAGDGGRGFADGPGATARFSDPFGLAIDARGAIYVADAGATNRIRRIAPDGRTTTLPGVFDTPSGVAVDRAGNVYVADTGANLIRRISRRGLVTTIAGDGRAGFRDGPASAARFDGPIGVAVDKAGNVYVADTYNDRVRLITPAGQVRTLAGGAGIGFADGQGSRAAFNTPCGVALTADGGLLVADMGNDAVRRVEPNGQVTTLARASPNDRAAPLRGPIGLAAAADGRVYVATFRRGRIVEVSPSGEVRILTGRDAWIPQNRSLTLARPAGVALDRHGALYVAESARYAVRKLAPRRQKMVGDAERAPTSPALLRAKIVPWPVTPQEGWREVVGNMGEVRGARNGDNRDHLHAGLDVQAGVGETVLASADEKVVSPRPNWDLDGLGEGLQVDQLTYIHMKVGRTPSGAPIDPAHFQFLRDPSGQLVWVRVRRGTRFHVGDPLGSVNRMAHVHLELGPGGADANPMGLRLPGLSDHFAPRIRAVQLRDAQGAPLTERVGGRLLVRRDAGPYAIVVDAWDQVDGNAARRRLGLYSAGYQILRADGSPAPGFERPLVNIVFDRLPLQPDAAKIVYAPESGETVHGALETRFLYVVTNRVRNGRAEIAGWRPADLPPGDYVVRIHAADYAGNEALDNRDVALTVR
jgi:sugar lactone lactonase YvrE